MNTKLAALSGTLMILGCGPDSMVAPDLARPEASDLEMVFIDCTDLDDEVGGLDRPTLDGAGNYAAVDDEGAPLDRPATGGPNSIATTPGVVREFPTRGEREFPTSVEPNAWRPRFDGADTFAVADAAQPRPPLGRPTADGPNSIAMTAGVVREFPTDGDRELPTSVEPNVWRPQFDGAETFAVADDARPHLGGRPSVEGPDLVDPSLSSGRQFPRRDDVAATDDDAARELPNNPCDCADSICLEEWVEANLGCDVCATFQCGEDDYDGACLRCE